MQSICEWLEAIGVFEGKGYRSVLRKQEGGGQCYNYILIQNLIKSHFIQYSLLLCLYSIKLQFS